MGQPVSDSASMENVTLQCNSTALQIDLGAPTLFNAVMTREDLSKGQRITSYAVDFYDDAKARWESFAQCGSSCTIPGGSEIAHAQGVRGISVGARLVDFVPATTSSKVRFRCTSSMSPDSIVHIRSFSVHKGSAPVEDSTRMIV